MNKAEKIKLIKDTCCMAMGTKWKEVNTAKRTDALAKTRHLIMFFLWRYTRLGLKEIGLEFKHSFKTCSVIYCRNKAWGLIKNDSKMLKKFLEIFHEIQVVKGIEPTRMSFKIVEKSVS